MKFMCVCFFLNSFNFSMFFLEKNPINFIYSVDRIMDFSRAVPTCYRTNFLDARTANKMQLFIHNTSPYIHLKLDSPIDL